MSQALTRIGVDSLRAMAVAIESGRLAPPIRALALRAFVGSTEADDVAGELHQLAEHVTGPRGLAAVIRLLVVERERALHSSGALDLVWSGPELPGSGSRDTAVVVRELFAGAKRSVLIAGYAVYQGKRVFEALAKNMDATPILRARMFLNVHRSEHDERSEAELTREFAEEFRRHQWPGARFPEVYYDPRALALNTGPRACLHAKCLVVDEQRALVTSANFTEAAQERNIEAGVLIESPGFARALASQFENLVARDVLRRLAGLR